MGLQHLSMQPVLVTKASGHCALANRHSQLPGFFRVGRCSAVRSHLQMTASPRLLGIILMTALQSMQKLTASSGPEPTKRWAHRSVCHSGVFDNLSQHDGKAACSSKRMAHCFKEDLNPMKTEWHHCRTTALTTTPHPSCFREFISSEGEDTLDTVKPFT